MTSKRKIALIILSISIIILMSLGTYSFFSANIAGNPTNKNTIQTTGTLRIEYTEGQVLNASNLMPGWSGTKTFKIKNTGTLTTNYDIVLEDILNTFIQDELIYSGTCISNQTTCESITQDVVDVTDFFLKENISIKPNEEHSYTINLEFIETNQIQNYNYNADFTGRIGVYETNTHNLNSKL